ncbi:hypothetical protein [Oceanobacillus sp. FSL W7-1309]|uniref:hypothetical protein n=1 Tax=Oceanobacillus sp. FSL W7-1309 TaxID=2954539 RepID=UPI0030F82458
MKTGDLQSDGLVNHLFLLGFVILAPFILNVLHLDQLLNDLAYAPNELPTGQEIRGFGRLCP